VISAQLPFRYAVYFCPSPDSDWGLAGAQWLGRCAITGKTSQQLEISGIDSELFRSLTSDPKRYGWHATLKAPFKLAPEHEVGDLLLKLHQLAKSLKPFDLPKLEVSSVGGFLSLRPKIASDELDAAAAMCVRDLQSFSLPLTEKELTRRRNKAELTPEQDKLLVDWGYPWVLDEFNFHFSLTGSLDSVDAKTEKKLIQAAKHHFQNLSICRFDRIALVIEPEAGKDFEVIKLLELYP
jgi:Protein of unknown function (DUF1045)